MSKRELWAINIGVNAMGLVCALLLHSVGLIIWNFVWLMIDVHFFERS